MHRETEPENMSFKGASQPHNIQSQKRKRSNKRSNERNESNNSSIESNERPEQTGVEGSFGSDQITVNSAPNELRLVLLGKPGVGKSATGNTILGNKRFDDGLSMSSKSKRERAMVEERELVLIDTPDFFDTQLTDEELQQEVLHCLALCSPGPHAFLLVIPIKFIGEHQRTVEMILEMFHEDVIHHTILIFSHADRLGEESIEGFISRQNQKVQELVDRFERRFVAFDNTNPTDRDQVSRLLQEVDQLLARNENRHFTCPITEGMQEAQRIIQEEMAERMMTIKKEVKKLADDRLSKFIASMNEESQETERKRKRIQSRIEQIETDIKKEKKNVRPIPARLERFRASLQREKESMTRHLNRKMEERKEREEIEKKDLDIWIKEEELRRLSGGEQNNALFSDHNMELLIKLFKFLLKVGAEYAPELIKVLFPAFSAGKVRSFIKVLASMLGFGTEESGSLFRTVTEVAVKAKEMLVTHCSIQ